MAKYNVNGTVTITLDIITTFDDDGKVDLGDQAYQAVIDAAEIPLSLLPEAEVEALVYEKIEEEAA